MPASQVELKRNRTPRDTLAQVLEYASFAEELDTEQLENILRNYLNDEAVNLADYHKKYFNIEDEEAITFNKDQRLVIVGQRMTNEILQTSSSPIHWGSKGFSLNVDKNGIHVAVCFGYPPNSVYKQSIYTALVGRGGLLSKLEVPEGPIEALWHDAEATGLFQKAGKELKCLIDRRLSSEEIETILNWVKKVIRIVQRYDLK
jgi:hypothetical protein